MSSNKVVIFTAGGSDMDAAVKRLAADGYSAGILSPSGEGEAIARELGGIGVTESNQKYPPRAHFIAD